MNPTDTGCNGYWINVQAYTYGAPDAYKCLTQAEYDAFNAQHEAAEQMNMHLFGVVLISFVGIALCIAAIVFIIKKWIMR